MGVARLAALLVLLTSAQQPSSRTPPVYVRPEQADAGPEIHPESGARDHDPNGTNTWATMVFNRSCTTHGGCTGTSSAATTWHGFPAGYRARRLVVYWKAASSVAMFGGSSQVRAVVEYSTGGQIWTPIDRFVENATMLAPVMKRADATLAAGVKPETLRVRGRLDVQLIACPNAECAANLPNPSNLSGQVWISDIRLEVDEPVLTASHERVKASDAVTFTIEGAPNARISNWKYTPSKGPVVTRDEGHTESAWRFSVKESGTVSVSVELDGQIQLKGRRFELSAPIVVRQR
jgi:hypothetical protein